MIKFLLVLYFAADKLGDDLTDEESDAIGDDHITKMVEMPVIPRIGEYIRMGDNFLVGNVQHDVMTHEIEVECDVDLFNAVVAFAEDKEGWNFDHLKPTGQELLLARVKKFEEGRRKDHR